MKLKQRPESPVAMSLPRWVIVVLLAVGAWFVGTHLVHVFTEAINWDEFALLDRADRTLRLGHVAGGGRPGLVSIGLMPFVRDCIDSVRSVVNARLAWQAITLIYLTGVYFLVRRWFVYAGRFDDGRVQGLLAVALLAFLPAFVTWSVQVRTDQPALALATWGGVLLLSTGYGSAALAGLLFGLGVLCTQKALYVIALGGVLYLTASAARVVGLQSPIRAQTTDVIRRLAVVVVVAAIAIALYTFLVPTSARLVSSEGMSSALETMNWYRERQGYRIYTVHADRLIVHWALLLLTLAWTVRTVLRRDISEGLVLAAAWGTFALGLLVVRSHGSSFPYFWMTAGLFLAVMLAIPAGRPLSLAGRLAWPVIASMVALTAVQSSRESIEMLYDSQHEQRATMQLVLESGLRGRRGYQVEGALFCVRDPDPLPVMFSRQIGLHYRNAPEEAGKFVDEFRNRPIAYFIESYRMNQFPPEVRDFWGRHYVWYARSLFVAGFRIQPGTAVHEIDVIVPGNYRWQPDSAEVASGIQVGGSHLRPYEVVRLETGPHLVKTAPGATGGLLIMADLPATTRDAYPAFYLERQIMQLSGRR